MSYFVYLFETNSCHLIKYFFHRLFQSGESSIKRVKVEQEIDQTAACDVDAGERAESNSMEAVAVAADVNELPKEMREMKIRGDGNDDNENSVKVS